MIDKIQELIPQLQKTTQIYYDYINKYQQSWEQPEVETAYTTLDNLNIYLSQLFQFDNFLNNHTFSQTDEQLINDYLPQIEKFSSHILTSLESFVS